MCDGDDVENNNRNSLILLMDTFVTVCKLACSSLSIFATKNDFFCSFYFMTRKFFFVANDKEQQQPTKQRSKSATWQQRIQVHSQIHTRHRSEEWKIHWIQQKFTLSVRSYWWHTAVVMPRDNSSERLVLHASGFMGHICCVRCACMRAKTSTAKNVKFIPLKGDSRGHWPWRQTILRTISNNLATAEHVGIVIEWVRMGDNDEWQSFKSLQFDFMCFFARSFYDGLEYRFMAIRNGRLLVHFHSIAV